MEKPAFLPGAILLALTLPSPAALLLYEGFTGYTAGSNLNTLAANGNTTGIATTGGATYGNDNGSNAPTGLVITNTGLSLGSLVTSGGAINFATSTSVASIGITSTIGGTTLWGSYLAKLNSTSNTSAQGVDVRVNSSSTSSASAAYFRSDADSRGSSGEGPAVAYGNAMGSAASALSTGTTFILISKFTGVGETGAGDATIWALDGTQFEAFVAAGRTEAYLNGIGNVTAMSTSSRASGSAQNWDGSYFEIVTAGTTGTLDEFRYGDSLFDVTPVPEPASVSLLGAGACLMLRRRRKQG